MSSDVLNPNGFGKAEISPSACEPVIALVAEEEFEAARAALGLESHPDYQDWLDARFGRQMGLAMAGVDAPMVKVGLQGFLDWCTLAGNAPNEEALDAFAAMVRVARNSPPPAAIADLNDAELAPSAEPAFADSSELHRFRSRPGDAGPVPAEPGLSFDGLSIRINDFLAWCWCVDERPCEASFERYAQLLLEHFLSE